ncbi:hypothetical protein [Nocardia arthritidis]|uniref:Uncharacterized protein n=1 Tax=Nocardia arthritidis TaxID=228602 RepID=A0A6G9Y9U9_9NOCA|nr:hypothetical protein [Nocardia arthritidis]QIS09938.1 hypothetical protein F5544_10200 [Nocardia arthritidis]
MSGLILLALAIPRSLDWWWRSVNAASGALFVGYGIYLAFFFHTGTYLVLLKVFVLPPILIAISLSTLLGKRKNKPGR